MMTQFAQWCLNGINACMMQSTHMIRITIANRNVFRGSFQTRDRALCCRLTLYVFFCGTRRADACSAVCLSQRRAPTPTNCFSVASFFNKLACYFCMLCSVCLVLIAFNYVSKAKEVSFLHKLHLHSSPLRCHDCA